MTALECTFLGNRLQTWLVASVVTVGVLVALRIVERVVLRRLAVVARKTETDLDDLVAELGATTKFYLIALLAIYAGSLVLSLPDHVTVWFGTVSWIAFLIQVAIWGDALIAFWLTRYQEEHLEEEAERVTTIKALSFVVRLALLTIVVLLALDNIPGVQVSTLVSSLGITGIAVALAVQNILADLFASLTIALDRPFVIGDFVVVGDDRGTVEHIGLKSTRIRSLSGEQLIVSNNDLLSSRVRNYGRMSDRRVTLTVGVACETPLGKLEGIPAIMQEIVERQQRTRFDRAHFREFGAFSHNFELVYHVLDSGYGLHMDIRQAINLAILRRFQEEGIELPYPTQTLHVRGGTGELQT